MDGHRTPEESAYLLLGEALHKFAGFYPGFKLSQITLSSCTYVDAKCTDTAFSYDCVLRRPGIDGQPNHTVELWKYPTVRHARVVLLR